MSSTAAKLVGPAISIATKLGAKSLNSSERRLLESIPYGERFERLVGEVDLYGTPFYYDLLRLHPKQLDMLFERIHAHDSYGFSRISVDNPLVVDIGAHIGTFPRFVLHKKPQAKVFAFEPDRGNHQILKDNLQCFENASANWLAMSEEKGELELYTSSKVDWRSTLAVKSDFIKKPEFEAGEYQTAYTVEVSTLDDYFEEHNLQQLDFLKITVPGEIELHILKGARNLIAKNKPAIALYLYESNSDDVDTFLTKEIGGYVRKDSPWVHPNNHITIYECE